MSKLKSSLLAFVIALTLGISSSFAEAVFVDVASDHPYYPAINYLYENGIIQGYEDHTFRPEKTVNRAEALKIILLGSNLVVPEIQAQTIFPDVLHDSWYGKFVLKAKNLGIVSGDGGTGIFRPGDTVNLAEALKILLKTNNITPKNPTNNPYLDVPTDAWFAPYFYYAKTVGLLDAKSSENVMPQQAVTRGLLAELMYRLATEPLVQADGKASYYGAAFHGRTTASGEVFDASAFTAAHLTYSFGTFLKVTNLENNKSVVVKVNDRGPYGNAERVIDLSQAAFEAIAPLSRGIITVSIEETVGPEGPVSSEASDPTPELSADLTAVSTCTPLTKLDSISKNAFDDIVLDADLSNHWLAGEVITLKGKSLASDSKITVFWIDADGKQTALYDTLEKGAFNVPLSLSTPGKYQLGILPGESGNSVVETFEILPTHCLAETHGTLPAPTGFAASLKNGETVLSWTSSNYNAYRLFFKQGTQTKTFYLPSATQWTPFYPDFKGFKPGSVAVTLQGGNLTIDSFAEGKAITWSKPASFSLNAQEHFDSIIEQDQVTVQKLSTTISSGGTLEATFIPKLAMREEAALILPSGQVKEVLLKSASDTVFKNANDISIFPASDTPLTFSYKTTEPGLYFIEINNAEGLAAINVPVYPKGEYPLIPNVNDLSDKMPVELGADLTKLRNSFLDLVNKDRSKYGLSPLALDANINKLAQYRSGDMVKNKYFSHWDSKGRSANDLRANYGIQPFVSENLAKDINLEMAQYGLMRSAIHRANILNAEWTRVGFGISKDSDGTYIFVQLFSTDPLNLSDPSSLRQTVLQAINEKRGSAPLVLEDALNSLAQTWTDKMVTEDFFDFVDNTGKSLIDNIRAAGVKVSLGTYLVGNSNFSSAIDQIKTNEQITETHFKKLGVGIKQDSVGIIKITLIYTD